LIPALLLIVAASGAWAFATSFDGVLVLDDVRAIVRNQTIRTLWPVTIPLSPPSASTVAGRPVANLTFALSYALGSSTPEAIDPAAFHAANLAIHLTAALLLFGVVRRTLSSPRLRPVFGAAPPWLAGAVALIWVVHPLQTSAVTYVAQRVESLMGLFYLLTMYASIRAADGGRRGRWWTAAAVAGCAAGMATKETMVTAPVAVAIWDRLFRQPDTSGRGRVRWGTVAGLAATWLLLAVLVQRQFRGPSVNLDPSTVWLYARTQAEVIVHYLRLAFVPSPLVFLYDWALMPAPLWRAWQAAVVLALLALTAAGLVGRHPASFLGAWFFLILAPSSSVLPIITEVAAEHRMYLPLASVVAGVVVGLSLLGQRLVPSSSAASRLTAARASAAIVLAAAVVALGLGTRARSHVYASAVGLWQDTVEKRPEDARPHIAYGEALAAAGRFAEAEAELRKGTELAPQDAFALVRLGSVLAQQRKYDEAVSHLVTALAVSPGNFDAHRFLADIRALRGEDESAVEHYEAALATVPADARVLTALAAVLAGSRDPNVRNPARARGYAERAVAATGGQDARALQALSAAQAADGSLAEAARTARSAAAVARARGEIALADALEYRALSYESVRK